LANYPSTGICFDCQRIRYHTYEVESLGIRLCKRHIKERILRGTWPDPPRMETDE